MSQYHKEYYQAHKEEIKARSKAWYKKHKEERKEYRKVWYQTHKEEQNTRSIAYNKEHKEEIKDYQKEYQKVYMEQHKEERREYQRDYQKARYQAHHEEMKEQQRKYKQTYYKLDVNSKGKPKEYIRCKSRYYLSKHGKKIPGYQIHHCCTYNEPYKFIYCSKEMHMKIHQYLRDNNIDADSNHYEQIKHLLDETVVLYGV